jgi:hypothetical protein
MLNLFIRSGLDAEFLEYFRLNLSNYFEIHSSSSLGESHLYGT